ncbi:MAG: FtsX-like permease family protein, partial [Chryseolinea sp.]
LNKNIGFEKDNIVSFDVEGKVAENVETFLTELKKVNGVLEASSSLGSMISQGGGIPGTLKWNDKTVTIQVGLVNYGLLELFGFKMKEGRMFSKDHPSDVNAVIYNEAALKAIGVENAVGIKIDNSEVIGVVEDFHFQTLHEVVKPFAFRLGLQPEDAMTITVKIKSGTDQQTIENLQVFYNHYNPGFVFTYNFLDQIYQARYVSEKRIGTLSKYAASIAVIISCLGLFALAAFTTERRTKEISIRKVLGSTEAGILLLLTKDFTKVVLIAVVIALPLSYYLSTYWLGTFAYKIDLKLWYFIATPMFMILIAIVTIAGQTIRAARSNPVNGLKAE